MQLSPAPGNIPMLQLQRDRQDEWLRFSVGKGVYSSPDRHAPPHRTGDYPRFTNSVIAPKNQVR